MGVVTCTLNLEQLIPLAAAKGLSTNDVLEANLVHLIYELRRPQFVAFVNAKDMYLQSQDAVEEAPNEAELVFAKYLNDLPAQLSNLADAMEANGGLNFARGRQNWAIVEMVMAENDPDMRDALEARDGKSTDITFH